MTIEGKRTNARRSAAICHFGYCSITTLALAFPLEGSGKIVSRGLPAIAAYAGNRINCAITDQTPVGCKLQFPLGLAVPDEFLLLQAGRPPQEVRVEWRRYPEVGVLFAPA